MLSDAPPSRDDVTTSATCRDCIEVKTFTSSGMTAPARVPQVITRESLYQSEGSPPRSGITSQDTRKVSPIEITEVSHTRVVRGASKSILSAAAYRARANAALMK